MFELIDATLSYTESNKHVRADIKVSNGEVIRVHLHNTVSGETAIVGSLEALSDFNWS